MPETPDIDTLCEQLENKSARVRGEAQKTLINMGQPAFVPLTQVFRTTGESGVRVIMSMLKKINSVQAEEFLSAIMVDSDPLVRVRAFEAASVINPAIPLEPVLAALKDSNLELRKKALSMLSGSHDELAEVMLHDPEEELRRTALFKLADAGNKLATEPIMEMYRSGNGISRGDAIRYLAELRDVRAAPLLIDALGDESGEGYATGTWRWVTNTRSPGLIPDEAYAALRQFGAEARPALKSAMLHHTDPIVRQKVQQLLQLLR